MLNDRLRLTRLYRKKTQQQMANALGIALRNYQKYEEGVIAPTNENLVVLADVLNTSVDFLLGRDEFLKSLGVTIDIPLEAKPRRSKAQKKD